MAVKQSEQTVVLVKVLPRSSTNQIVGKEEGVFRVKLTAPPIDGRANKALKELLSKRLRIAKRDIQIISGERSKIKSVRIHGLAPGDVDRRLGKGP